MKQPKWKKWLSYFFEFHIESTSSEFNKDLHLLLCQGRYQLATQNAIYSYADLYSNYSLTFQQVKIETLPIQNVLILGFGLGSIPYMLENIFHQNYHYTAVEIDEEIIYLFNKYVGDEIKSPIEFICGDAEVFMAVNQNQYDLIIVDLFIDDEIPVAFETPEFLEHIKKALSPKGMVFYNRLALYEKDRLVSKGFFNTIFQPIFPNGTYLEVDGNYMLTNRSDFKI